MTFDEFLSKCIPELVNNKLLYVSSIDERS